MNNLIIPMRAFLETYVPTVQWYFRRLKFDLTMNGSTTNWKTRQHEKIIQIDDSDAVSRAARLLELGSVIALPSDTVYGLACSANNPDAIRRLYDMKGRHELKPVAICVAEVEHLRRWAEAEHLDSELLEQLLPGAVTIVLRKSEQLNNPYLNPGTAKIGIRIPDYKFIRDISRQFVLPIALTSANKSASMSTLNIDEFECLWPYLGAVFDGGQLGLNEQQRAASTVIDLSEKGTYKIIRSGVAAVHTIRVVEKFNFLPKQQQKDC